jgi:hypothetical protein
MCVVVWDCLSGEGTVLLLRGPCYRRTADSQLMTSVRVQRWQIAIRLCKVEAIAKSGGYM